MSSEKYNKTSKIVKFLSDFPSVPMLPTEEASANCQVAMLISFDSTQHIRITFFLLLEKIEIGPRINVSRVLWEIQK